jgi:probable HAF family extracellular repeat protein
MRRIFLPTLLKLGGIAGLAIGSQSAGAQSNFLTDLGAGFGFGLNDSGQAVLSTGLYSKGAVTPLGMSGYAINASGQVAGMTSVAEHAALYSNGTVTDLGVLPGGNLANGNTEAFGINSGGQVVGLGLNGTGEVDAFSYSNGTMTDLHWLPGATPDFLSSEAYGVNDGGLIVGISVSSANTTPSTYDAFSYDNGTFTDLGPGAAFAVNASGQITGVLAADPVASQGNTIPSSGHAFLYGNGTMSDLGVLRGGTLSLGRALNATGQLVGSSNLNGSSNTHAFFYNGVMTDLNSLIDAADPLKPYVTLTDARGVNAMRLILANGVDSRTQQQHAYLMQGPWIDIAPGTLAFASQRIGTASSTETLTLTNSGSVPLAIGSMSVTGDFSQNNDCGASLAAGGHCTVAVTFMPTAAGDRTGTLTVTAAGAPFVVALSGVAPIEVTLSTNPSSTTTGTPATLTWTQSPGASCSATGGTSGDGWAGTFLAGGNKSVTESDAGIYQLGLTCSAGSQTATAQISLTVTLAPVTVTLSASPSSITAGQSTTLTWSSHNATSCTATGGSANDVWPGAKATAGGSQVVLESSAGSIQYALTCTAGSQIGQAQVTVIVAWPPVTVTLSASPTTITAGQSTKLTWGSTNATSCSATGGGSGDSWQGTRAPTGSLDVSESSSGVTASQTLVFGITCTSSQSGLSAETSTDVVENVPPPAAPAKSGGGAFNGLTLFLLFGLSCANRLRRRGPGLRRGQPHGRGGLRGF